MKCQSICFICSINGGEMLEKCVAYAKVDFDNIIIINNTGKVIPHQILGVDVRSPTISTLHGEGVIPISIQPAFIWIWAINFAHANGEDHYFIIHDDCFIVPGTANRFVDFWNNLKAEGRKSSLVSTPMGECYALYPTAPNVEGKIWPEPHLFPMYCQDIYYYGRCGNAGYPLTTMPNSIDPPLAQHLGSQSIHANIKRGTLNGFTFPLYTQLLAQLAPKTADPHWLEHQMGVPEDFDAPFPTK